MNKIFLAVAVLTGTLANFAHADTYSKFKNRVTYADDMNRDTTSTSSSATDRSSYSNSDNKASYDTTSSTSMSEMNMGTLGERKLNVGVFSGVNSPHGDLASSAEYGLVIGYEPLASVGAGIEASTTRLNTDNDLRQTNVLLRGTYTLGGDIPVLRTSYIGVGAGPVIVSNKVRWAGAPIVGFDVPLSQKSHDYVSLGLEAKYLFVTNTDVPDIFSTALAVKYWF